MNIRAFSIGISAALLALACGSNDDGNTDKDADGSGSPVVTPALPDIQPETCADNQFLAGCPPVGDTPAVAPPSTQPVVKPSDPAALAKAAAENVLLSQCGQCHGTALSVDEAKGGGFNYINDIDKLVASGKIIPLDPEGSRIIQRMRAGEMPPPNQGFSPVPDSDIEVVASYIKNPQFWDVPEQDDCSKSGQVFGFDDLYAAVADNIAREDAEDQINFRYIALTNRFTAGVCADTALDNDRQALTKMVNMLST